MPPKDERYEEERGAYVSSFNCSENVTSFKIGIGDGLVGLHLSSYEVQEGGTAQAAAGRDVFLVHNQNSGTIHKGLLNLAITKNRVRSEGCCFATHSTFLLSDVNHDGFLDIGVIKEERGCKLVNDVMGAPFHERHPLRWYIFAKKYWQYDAALDGRIPRNSCWKLPLIDLIKSPVDYVNEVLENMMCSGSAY